MTDLNKTCLNCSAVLGCRYLADSGGMFVPERVITEEHFRECPEWAPIGGRQKWVRDVLYGLQGDGGVRVLQQLPKTVMSGLVQQEKEEQEMNLDDNPDFASMLREGMTTTEREEQLRYETDAMGNVLVDEQGNKRPRAQYVIGKYACDPNQHIQLDHSAGMFYKLDEVIKYILDKEAELGLLVKTKKPRKKNAKPAGAEAPADQQQEETKMPIDGRKIIRPTKNAPAPQATEEESAPPAAPKTGPVGLPKVGGKIAQPPKRGATVAPPPQEAQALGVDFRDIIPDIQVAVGQAVQAALEDVANQLAARIDEQANKIVEAITILHDLAIQTSGTFHAEDGTPLDEKYDKEKKIFDHLG